MFGIVTLETKITGKAGHLPSTKEKFEGKLILVKIRKAVFPELRKFSSRYITAIVPTITQTKDEVLKSILNE